MKIKSRLDYHSVIKYALFFLTVVVFNNLEKNVMPYSTAIVVSSIFNGLNPILSSLLFLLSFVIYNQMGLLLFGAVSCLIFTVIFYIYKKLNITPKYEIILLGAVSMVVFVLIGDTLRVISTESRIICAVLTTLLTFISHVFIKAVTQKGLKFKLGYDEFFSIGIICVLFGLGISNSFSPYVWKGVTIVLIMMTAYLYKKGFCTLVSAILGISLSIYYGNVSYVSVFLIMGIVAESLIPLSRYVSGIAVICSEYLLESIFGIYGGYLLADFISTLSGVLIFFFIPTKVLKSLKDQLYLFREKQLARISINRNRLMLSNRLYELSGVFTEMSDAFNAFKKCALTEDKAKTVMENQIVESVCKQCPGYSKCNNSSKNNTAGVKKMIDLGFAKGKLSLIDLPREISETCVHPNNILYGTNKLLADYRSYLINNLNVENGRNLIAKEAQGVSEILRGLALESGALLKYQSRLERILSDNLYKEGFAVSELLIYGEEKRITVSIILTMKEFDVEKICRIISKTVQADMELTDKANISKDKCYLSFKRSAVFDAVFGISQTRKDGSTKSGDTHSVTRLMGDRFLVALSDGMGSGETANNISSVSLSLIESFYKAGMESSLILDTVNKLMAINAEDTFTALDVSVIDLKNCTVDFIKYGAPYGFIIGESGIRIVEGNTLPLGILEELKPTVCSTQLNDGDIVLLITDGISDAFGSSGDLIEFLRGLPAKNPQTLADDVLKKALSVSGGKKADDMSALAVRIFKKKKTQNVA